MEHYTHYIPDNQAVAGLGGAHLDEFTLLRRQVVAPSFLLFGMTHDIQVHGMARSPIYNDVPGASLSRTSMIARVHRFSARGKNGIPVILYGEGLLSRAHNRVTLHIERHILFVNV